MIASTAVFFLSLFLTSVTSSAIPLNGTTITTSPSLSGVEIPQNSYLVIPKYPQKPSYAVGQEISSRLKVYSPRAIINENGGVDLVLDNNGSGEGGSSLVSEASFKTGTVCATIRLPSPKYGGVAMTFYSLSHDNPSWNLGQDDEQDFEWLGNTGKMQTNVFKNGQQQPVYYNYPPSGNYKMCLVNTGSEVKYYVNDQELTNSRRQINLTKNLWVWFSIWVTSHHWPNCCGQVDSNRWIQSIDNFSIYKSS